jgi:hypothetical protein
LHRYLAKGSFPTRRHRGLADSQTGPGTAAAQKIMKIKIRIHRMAPQNKSPMWHAVNWHERRVFRNRQNIVQKHVRKDAAVPRFC